MVAGIRNSILINYYFAVKNISFMVKETDIALFLTFYQKNSRSIRKIEGLLDRSNPP